VRIAFLALAVSLSVVTVAGCHRSVSPSVAASDDPAAKHYPIRGVVLSTDPSAGSVLLKHDEIVVLMPAMTMSYKLQDPSVLSELHPGDVLKATLLVDEDAAGPKNLRLTNLDILAEGKPDYKPAMEFHLPTPGDVVPGFKLLNQSNHTISLKQYRGKVVALTFIYTRCPLSDYCPRMSHNFATIDKDLASDPKLYAKTHLLSISFDPDYDTPKVLRSYGGAYTGRYEQETFRHWEFAAPPKAELEKMRQFFDVGVTPGPNGTLQHSLSTVVIGKDGKVVAFWPTNDWTVDQVLAKIKAAAE
jgi:protein SCO1/2